MNRIAIHESTGSNWYLLWLISFMMAAIDLYLFVVLREDFRAGQFQLKHLLIINGIVLYMALGSWIRSFWTTKNFYYDPTNRVLYFTRPLLFGWKHKQCQIGEPEKVAAVMRRMYPIFGWNWKVPSIAILCRGKSLDDLFFINCDSMDEAQHLTQKLGEVASLSSW